MHRKTSFLRAALLFALAAFAGDLPRAAGAEECARARTSASYERRISLDGWIAMAGAAGIVAAVLVEGSSSPLTRAELERLDRADVNQLDRCATENWSEGAADASDVLIAGVVAAPVAFLAGGSVRSDWRTYTLMYVETMTFAAVLPSIAKGTVERIRPFVYNEAVPAEVRMKDDPRGSFFSRHTSLAFASAVFMSTTFARRNPDSPALPYVWAGSLAAAAAVGYLRIEAGEHFPTDVFVGAVVGGAAGWLVPWLHENRRENVVLAPVVRGSQPGLALELRF